MYPELNSTSSKKAATDWSQAESNERVIYCHPSVHHGSWVSVWSAKAKHVKEMICSESLEDSFYLCSSVEAGKSIPQGLKFTCPVSQRQGVTLLKECQTKKWKDDKSKDKQKILLINSAKMKAVLTSNSKNGWPQISILAMSGIVCLAWNIKNNNYRTIKSFVWLVVSFTGSLGKPSERFDRWVTNPMPFKPAKCFTELRESGQL